MLVGYQCGLKKQTQTGPIVLQSDSHGTARLLDGSGHSNMGNAWEAPATRLTPSHRKA